MADAPPGAAAQEMLAQEQALLSAARRALARRPRRSIDRTELRARLLQLREESTHATARDLPTLLTELNNLQALLDQPGAAAAPDADSPYFAHLRVVGPAGERDYLLGQSAFIDEPAGVRIVDWKEAPVARLFYRYREGDEFEEELPGRTLTGRVVARRVVHVRRGRLERVEDGARVLQLQPDGTWNESARHEVPLGGGAGTAVRSARAPVTALLDRDQYEAIDSDPDVPLLVLGVAGSGKTTVALHRLAMLATRAPGRFPLSRMHVLVPERGLARLAQRLLEPLGGGRAVVRTMTAWLRALAADHFGPKLPTVYRDTPPLVCDFKRHPALLKALEPVRPRRIRTLRGLRRVLGEHFSDPVFVRRVVDAAGDLPLTTVESVVAHTRLQLAENVEREVATMDPLRTETLDRRPIDAGTPDELAGTIDLEDLALLLHWGNAVSREPPPAHLVLDEAEDLSLVECTLVQRWLRGAKTVTVAGDEAQQTTRGFAGWEPLMKTLGLARHASCRLPVSYRCPRPVAELAQQVLRESDRASAAAAQEGPPVERLRFSSQAHCDLHLSDSVRELVAREPGASLAIVAGDADTARAFYRLVADVPAARLVLDGEFTFDPGVDVTTVDWVKGLEWDYVFVPDASAAKYPDEEAARRRLHVAFTRACWQLSVGSVGTPSPLVPAG